MLASIVPSAVYNLTEAGFRMVFIMWGVLLLAILSAGGLAKGSFGRESPGIASAT
jgi:hypothetical protein